MNPIIYCALVLALALTSISRAADEQPVDAELSTTTAQQAAQDTAKPTLTVSVTNPVYANINQSIEASGIVEAKEIASITSQASGLSLNKLFVDVGDTIKKGQLLAEYDDAAVKNDIAQAQAALQQAEIAHQQASANLKRIAKLRKSNAISAIEADSYIFQEKSAKAQVASAKAVLDNQKLRGSYAKVSAKFNGLIIEKQAVLGAVGNPGTQLFSVVVDSQLEWHADVPSEQLPLIKIGQTVNVALNQDATTADSALRIDVPGVVRKIDPTVNSQTRLGKVYVSMNENDNLKRGLFLRGEFILGNNNRLLVPITAVVRKDGFNYVFVVDEASKVQRVKVGIGQIYKDGVTITSGLNAQDRVVTTGVGFLSSGDLVKIVDQ